MSGATTIPLNRAWFTWSERPAELIFLPLGLRLTPVLYSTRQRAVSLIEPRRNAVRLGPHTTDGRLMNLATEFAGTGLAFQAAAPAPFAVTGGWTRTGAGEWGARFWVALAVTAGDARPRWDAGEGAVLVKIGARHAAIVADAAPLVVSGHDDLGELGRDLTEHGYFNLESRADTAPLLALRFNLELMPRARYAAAVADSEAEAIAAARAALAAETPDLPALQEGAGAGALDAVRDIIGWNTLWDWTNQRAYTAATRVWNLGDFAVWYNDQCYAALLAAPFDPWLARANLAAAHAGATPAGNVACIVTSHDAWVDRSQPPLGSLIAWMIWLRTGDRTLLAEHFEVLARNQHWWRRMRDPGGTGLISCGSSDTGEALYKGTHFGARNETGMDNSATHDEARYDEETRSLSTWDLGLNCAVALDAEMLGRIAAVLGRGDEAAEFAGLAEAHRTLIGKELWDEERQIFANRQRGGGFVRSLSPTSFYPLLCGAADARQTRALLAHIDDPVTFAAPWPLPNATRDDPAYADNVYWRGRIWANVNYLVWLGLRRAGAHDRAARLAAESFALFAKGWDEGRIAAENYNPETGEGQDQGDADPFYTWTALLPFMAAEEICGFFPWEGWCLTNGADARLGPVLTPLGAAEVVRAGGRLSLSAGGRARLVTDFPGRLAEIRMSEAAFAATLSASDRAAELVLPDVPPGAVIAAELAGAALIPEVLGEGSRLALPPGGAGRRLSVWMRPA